ncbi:hypothetical protein HYW54_02835 [Candidatus Gottesmanbacteria bacterium]|nr:hypothetical protein [Candidatus Gottesmanbacteria bacterium]
MKKIKKRDGTFEEYNQDKIAKVVTAAGLTAEETKKLVENVSLWIQNIKEEEVSSLEIRDKVIEELHKINPFAENFYVWYEKTKD